jgi:hypothetical protein
MECQDVRLMLAFTQRAAEGVDATERQAVEQHLTGCPECSSVAQGSTAFDRVIGAAMRAVPVPPAAVDQLSKRLAQRRPRPLPWIAAAAALLLSASMGSYWYLSQPAILEVSTLEHVASRAGNSADDVEQWFHGAGLHMSAPRQFDFRQLIAYDVVEFEGRRVPKLVFFHPSERNERASVAQVLVLRVDEFSPTNLPRRAQLHSLTSHTISEENSETFSLVFSTSDDLGPFLRDAR